MISKLAPRPYQADMERKIYNAWNSGHKNVMAVLPTGAGKTFIFTHIISKYSGRGYAAVVAHRQELVLQMSIALARWGVQHNIIAPTNVVKLIVRKQLEETGKSYYTPNSKVYVAGVDTLIARREKLRKHLLSTKMWVIDEAHHVVKDNKWGKAVKLFAPDAIGLGVTATPTRADGKALDTFDTLITGPTMRDLIDQQYLTDYRVFSIPNNIDLSQVPISQATGDYSKPKLVTATKKSRIVGDVVSHYIKHANGKLGVTFVTDVDTGEEMAEQYRASGIPALSVSHRTSDEDRTRALDKFKKREILQLVNVDLFGEGFDLPAIEVVSFARPTKSYPLFVQQFGRALRPLPGKDKAIILDHVGNVLEHGFPDHRSRWTLAGRQRQRSTTPDDVIPVRVCVACMGVYERTLKACPYCGHTHVPQRRDSIEQVDGDLTELDPATVRRIQSVVNEIDMSPDEYRSKLIASGCPRLGVEKNVKAHERNRKYQQALRKIIDMTNMSDKEFYWTFGIDKLTAKTLKYEKVKKLAENILTKV